VVKTVEAELWQRSEAVLGEGPSWDGERHRLSWVDILSSVVHVSDEQGRPVADHAVPGHVGAALPAPGGWLVALADRLAFLYETGTVEDLVPLEPHLPGNRANDAKCDPAGRAWVGTMSYDESRTEGALYRLGPGLEVVRVIERVGVSNGLAWSPDASVMYYIDSATHELRAYPYDLGSGGLGRPSMCSDDDGCLWVALFGGACVRRYTPQGELDMVVRLPVTYVTSCCFGGARGDHLFITSARRDLDEEGGRRQPLAGSVWVAHPGVAGPPAVPWQR
jgi:sugar lactone lactonase YvrE